MKLAFLAEGSLDCPLLRLSNFTVGEAGQLLAVVAELARGVTERVEVHRQPFIEAMSGCQLTLIKFSEDQGIRQVGPSAFEYAFTAGTWDNVAGTIPEQRERVSVAA